MDRLLRRRLRRRFGRHQLDHHSSRPQNSFSGDLVIAAGTITLAKDQGNIATMASFFSTDVRATWNLVGAPFTLSSLQTLKGAGTVAIANRTTWTGNTFASQIPTTISGLTISGTIEPGDSGPGTLTVTGGTVALAPSALLKLEINHATPAIHDRTALSHGLTIAAGATLELTVTGTLPLPQKVGETLVWTLPKGTLAAADSTLQHRFATSPNLSQWTPTAPTTQDATTFTLTLPAGPDRFFVRLLITTAAN